MERSHPKERCITYILLAFTGGSIAQNEPWYTELACDPMAHSEESPVVVVVVVGRVQIFWATISSSSPVNPICRLTGRRVPTSKVPR